jgi:hypothetical protein
MHANDRAGTEHLTSFGSRRFVSKKKMKLRTINALKREREKKSAKYEEEEERNSNTETSQSITKHASCCRCRHYDLGIS